MLGSERDAPSELDKLRLSTSELAEPLLPSSKVMVAIMEVGLVDYYKIARLSIAGRGDCRCGGDLHKATTRSVAATMAQSV